MFYIFSYYDPFTIGGPLKEIGLEECPTYPLSHSVKDTRITSDFQDGYSFNRPSFSYLRKKYTLNFSYMIETDMEKLRDSLEYETRGVESFRYYPDLPTTWVPSSTDYLTCIFTNSINYSLVLKNDTTTYWDIVMNFEEV